MHAATEALSALLSLLCCMHMHGLEREREVRDELNLASALAAQARLPKQGKRVGPSYFVLTFLKDDGH
jgi:hypothetical protein